MSEPSPTPAKPICRVDITGTETYLRSTGDLSALETRQVARILEDMSPSAGAARPVAQILKRCLWCGSPLDRRKRQDSKFCRKRCRQASWRFGVYRSELAATGRPMAFAYADPPYPGKAKYYFENQEVNYPSLIDRLTATYPDGWALSTSARALRDVLASCPVGPGLRVCAWFKGARATRSYRPLTSWEPLIVFGGRPLPVNVTCDVSDGLIYQGRFRAFPGAMIGMKPPTFAVWMFQQLGAVPGDSLDDLFPGSGAITVAWARYTGQVK